MQDQYSRTQLLLGKEAMEKLHNSHVAVFGIGGVGGRWKRWHAAVWVRWTSLMMTRSA